MEATKEREAGAGRAENRTISKAWGIDRREKTYFLEKLTLLGDPNSQPTSPTPGLGSRQVPVMLRRTGSGRGPRRLQVGGVDACGERKSSNKRSGDLQELNVASSVAAASPRSRGS